MTKYYIIRYFFANFALKNLPFVVELAGVSDR